MKKRIQQISKDQKESCLCKRKHVRSANIKPCEIKKTTKATQTLAVIKCDIGFGNTLFIRGEGISTLGWNKGIALTFDEKEQGWCFRTSVQKPIEFKVLINDCKWSEGENFTLSPGGKQTFEPSFLYS